MFSLSESTHPQLVTLLDHFIRTTYRATSSNDFNKVVLNNTIVLLNRDFAYVNIDNSNGQICDSYPETLPFLLSETIQVDTTKLSELLMKCKRARCRNRFVVPVIKMGNRLLCRSATLSASVEMLYRNGLEYVFGTKSPNDIPSASAPIVPDRDSFDNIRGADIQLLKFLGISHIVDLMLENQKYKYGMKVTSSEKIDKEGRYVSFEIVGLPFPGVEHFAEWVAKGYVESGLRFDWSQDFITAEMKIPDSVVKQADVLPTLSNWSACYQNWETVKLTQSYLKLLLRLFLKESTGVLVHCISGWDRTPLFVSLARISLWADGAIHQSLNAAEMLYFTIGYDWFLFSHDLVDRGKNRQEIFRYCFAMLQYIEGDEFSISSLLSNDQGGSANEMLTPGLSDCIDGLVVQGVSPRRGRLMLMRQLFENAYVLACTRSTSVVETYQASASSQHFGANLPNSINMSSLSRWFINLGNGNNPPR